MRIILCRSMWIIALWAGLPAVTRSQVLEVSTLAGATQIGSADGPGAQARFNNPYGVATDKAGAVYVADQANSTIRKITAGGVVSTFAGTVDERGWQDGSRTNARFAEPIGLAVDANGTVFVSDLVGDTIRRINVDGAVTTIAGLSGVSGIADGEGSGARFFGPAGLAVDGAGNVFVADAGNHTIRKVAAGGLVSTVAGMPRVSGRVDGVGANARFNSPWGLALDPAGSLYVTDHNNNTIRKIAPDGTVSTLAGLAGTAGSADGQGGAARFNGPWGLAVDGVGNVYVTDYWNSTIRRITPSGLVTTVAGVAGISGSADGLGSASRFSNPTGVAVDLNGNVYVADSFNNAVRLGLPGVSSASPSLTVRLTDDSTGPEVVLTWPTNAVSYRLESSASLSAGAVWVPSSGAVTLVGGSFQVSEGAGIGSRFYRLIASP